MKKTTACILAACLLLPLLLAGCTGVQELSDPDEQSALAPEPDVQEPEPVEAAPETPETQIQARVFAAAPQLTDALAVTVNQQQLEVYQGAEDYLLRLDAFASAIGAAVRQKKEADGRYSCRLTAQTFAAYFHENDADVIYDGKYWYVPMQPLVEREGFRSLTDTEYHHVYYTTDPSGAQTPEGYRVPVLMYHAVSDDCWGYTSLFVSPATLEQQLQLLLDEGYTPIWFEDLPNVAEYEKPVILTFDDGYDDNYTELFPILQKYNVKATIFVIAGQLGTSHKMTAEQVQELSQSGLVSIQSHTMTHGYLDTMDEETLVYQLEQSQLEIARLTGKVPYTVCYPEGRSSVLAREVAARYYDFGLLMNGSCYTTGTDPYLIPRYFVERTTDIWTFRSMLKGE